MNFVSGLCMLSVHRDIVNENKNKVEGEVLDRFAADSRRIALL